MICTPTTEDLAEESVAEAFAGALDAWTRDGIPDRPGAWLTTVAGNRALDRLRRARRGGELLERLGRDPLGPQAAGEEDPEMTSLFDDGEEIEDDRLRLIFTCCHPALALAGTEPERRFLARRLGELERDEG